MVAAMGRRGGLGSMSEVPRGLRHRACKRLVQSGGLRFSPAQPAIRSNLGLVTQNVQWLLLTGVSFVVSAYLQEVRGYNAIETGVIFTAVTAGLLGSSLGAERMAKRRSQRTLIFTGFVVTLFGIGTLLALVIGTPNVWALAPGLLLIGLGLGVMLTPSVNMVQSSFPEQSQGEISGLSRCISNLASSLGAAVAGTVLVARITTTLERSYSLAMIVLAACGLIGLAASVLLPRTIAPTPASDSVSATPPSPSALLRPGVPGCLPVGGLARWRGRFVCRILAMGVGTAGLACPAAIEGPSSVVAEAAQRRAPRITSATNSGTRSQSAMVSRRAYSLSSRASS
jgi:MFS family permease